MKILLIGEYSRLHNSLKEGLIKRGHNVTLIGKSDSFKNYPVDYSLDNVIFKSKKALFFAKAVNKIFKINLVNIENFLIFYFNKKHFKNYDIVQFYNESFIKSYSFLEIYALKFIVKNNHKSFLLCCGLDYISLKYAYEKKLRYSILTPYFESVKEKKSYQHILKILNKDRQKLHFCFVKHINGFISSDLDYDIPYKKVPKYLGMVPNPINTDLITQPNNKSDKIIIFHGVNTQTYVRKGNKYFDEALQIINKKYKEKVKIIRTENLPYNTYINYYNNCHILLDQIYAYDQGYNALEAMAKGKVVFTGAEKEWLQYYNLTEDTVAINALPDVGYLVDKLSFLINNPDILKEIGKNARKFIIEKHNYINSAQEYINLWTK